ncbi:peptidoglycan-binding protein [Phormidium tenue FACHB-886]|nr:peptidoglycan-binding protein [Phormidium tenue FACHB-886]
MAKLGYLADGIQPGKYTSVTEEAVEWFQGENDLEVDGKFELKTKAALTTALTNAVKRVPPPRVYCRLTRTGTTAYAGLEKLLLEFVDPKGRVLAKLDAISGAPGAQKFRVPDDPLSFPGSFEPIPQARYTIGNIDFAGGKDNYTVVHPHETNGIGPVWVPIIKTRFDDRDKFGFHMDWNRSSSPGSAGCVCVGTEPELENLVALLRRYDPRDLFVDWGIR